MRSSSRRISLWTQWVETMSSGALAQSPFSPVPSENRDEAGGVFAGEYAAGHWRVGKSGHLQSNAGRTRNAIPQTEATAKTQQGWAFYAFWPVLAVPSVGVEGEKFWFRRRVAGDRGGRPSSYPTLTQQFFTEVVVVRTTD